MSILRSAPRLAAGALLACICLCSAAVAQDAPPTETLDQKVARLEREVRDLREQRSGEGEGKSKGDRIQLGWQLQLHGIWSENARDHGSSIFKNDQKEDGWGIGVGLMAPLWPDLGPVDLLGYLGIDYRQLGESATYTAPISGRRGTVNYLDIVVAPTIRFDATEMFRPFARLGANIQVASPPADQISYLDVGFLLGAGIDVCVIDRVSLGLTYDYTWFGVADQEKEDFGALTLYLGFNF